MFSQVAKLLSTTGDPNTACFLGSAQIDGSVEGAARAGEYRIVYATPEKFTTPGFMDDLARLHSSGKLAFVAVDEVGPTPPKCFVCCLCTCTRVRACCALLVCSLYTFGWVYLDALDTVLLAHLRASLLCSCAVLVCSLCAFGGAVRVCTTITQCHCAPLYAYLTRHRIAQPQRRSRLVCMRLRVAINSCFVCLRHLCTDGSVCVLTRSPRCIARHVEGTLRVRVEP
jgi:hypothetical protein